MLEFFRGWKRKLGVVTLLMACVFAGVWVKSIGNVNKSKIGIQYVGKDQFGFYSGEYTCYIIGWFAGKIVLVQVEPADESHFINAYGDGSQISQISLKQKVEATVLAARELFREQTVKWSAEVLDIIADRDESFELNTSYGVLQTITTTKTVLRFHKAKTWMLPFWALVIPLTLLSAYLLLSKSKGLAEKFRESS